MPTSVPRIVSLIASATEIVDALGRAGSPGRAARTSAIIPKRVKRCRSARGRAFAVDADSREIDRLVKESARTSLSIYDVFDDVIERLAADPHPDADPVRGLRRSACATWRRPWRAA